MALVVRGAPITDPQALVALADLGVDVRVVCGGRAAAFHPKLWIAHSPQRLYVLSGSGNLSAGGLETNDEQFEYFSIPLDARDVVDLQERRLRGYLEPAVPLPDLIGTTYWAEWEQQEKARRQLAEKERDLDERLAVRAEASMLDALLYRDLNDLYERTKDEVRIPDGCGGDRPYVASRFKQAIERGRREGTLIPVVARIVKDPTEGLEHLANAGRPDLMVETLVLDTSKPYHHRFSGDMRSNARSNLEAYERRGGT